MITVTEEAKDKIASMCLENNMEAVRPFVYGGGCGGMQHSLTFADQKEERDTEIAPYLYVDPVAYQFMDVFKEQGGSGTCGGCGGATGPGWGH